MVKQTTFILALNLFVLSGSALARLEVSLDKQLGFVGESFQLEVRVYGDHNKPPHVPQISSTTMRKGAPRSVFHHQTSFRVYPFAIVPLVEGLFEVGPVSIELEGRVYESEALSFEAHPREQKEEVALVFVEREFSTATPYLNQAFLMKVKLFTRTSIRQPTIQTQFPDGFRFYPIEEQRRSQVLLYGHRYEVVEFGWVLIPEAVGEVSFDPFGFVLHIEDKRHSRNRGIDPFGFPDVFGRTRYRQQAFYSDPAKIEVKALPADPNQARFTRLVGDFTLTARLSHETAEVGDSIDLEIILSGYGEIDQVSEFELSNVPPSIKVYQDRGQREKILGLEEGLFSEFSQRFALVPSQPKTASLGSYEIGYFSVSKGEYVNLSVDLGSLVVTGEPYELDLSALHIPQGSGSSSVAERGTHHRSSQLFKRHDVATADVVLGGASMATALFGLIYCLYSLGHFSRRSAPPSRHRALQLKQRIFLILESLDPKRDVNKDITEVARLLRAFIVMHLLGQESSLTSQEVVELLSKTTLPLEFRRACSELFSLEEAICFAEKRVDYAQFLDLKKLLLDQVKTLSASNITEGK